MSSLDGSAISLTSENGDQWNSPTMDTPIGPGSGYLHALAASCRNCDNIRHAEGQCTGAFWWILNLMMKLIGNVLLGRHYNKFANLHITNCVNQLNSISMEHVHNLSFLTIVINNNFILLVLQQMDCMGLVVL